MVAVPATGAGSKGLLLPGLRFVGRSRDTQNLFGDIHVKSFWRHTCKAKQVLGDINCFLGVLLAGNTCVNIYIYVYMY